MNTYQRCTRCVMDNRSDDRIVFDDNGVCNYCTTAFNNMNKIYFPNEEGTKKLNTLIQKLKVDGKGKKYDCLMGISGGLDSSYLAYLGATKWGLRILGIHIDDGFDTEIAQKNIKNLCDKANIDLIIEKPDSEQYNNLTKAFILAEVPNIAIPQDNILFACLYKYAINYKINNFLSGSNFALESILQKGNTFTVYDMVHIHDIHKKYGEKPINKLPFLSQYKKDLLAYHYHIKTFSPLNYVDYNKSCAIKELKEFCNFNYYEAKHLENTLTKIIQLYWFPKKFNVDKRTSHL